MIGISVNLLIQVVTDHPFLTKFSKILLFWPRCYYNFASYSGDFLISRYSSYWVICFISSTDSFDDYCDITTTNLSCVGFQILCILSVIATAVVNLLPFDIDRLIGSSSDELTAVIHWHIMLHL